MHPEIYLDLPNDTYHLAASLSSTGVKQLLKNPYLYWYNSHLNPDKEPLDTAALKRGRVAHILLLEPQHFNSEFKIKEGVYRSGKEGVVGEGEYNEIQAACEVLRSTKLISKLIIGGLPEVSIFWNDALTGVKCRSRLDYIKENLIIDYKTVSSIEQFDITNSIARYGYDIQAGIYMDSIQKIINSKEIQGDYNPEWLKNIRKHKKFEFIFIFQEKKAPFLYRAVQVDPKIIELGQEKFRQAINLFKQYYDKYGANPWPSGLDSVEHLYIDDLPNKIFY